MPALNLIPWGAQKHDFIPEFVPTRGEGARRRAASEAVNS